MAQFVGNRCHGPDSPIPVWLPFTIKRQSFVLVAPSPPSSADLAAMTALLEQRATEQRAVEQDRRRRGR